MNFIADLHIHSKYSRATAKHLDLENLYISAQIKGITVIGTGDFTHPQWWQEITEKLVPAEEGLFALAPELARACDRQVPPACLRPVRFMLVTEISNIYKKEERTRKNHNLVFMPGLEQARQFNRELDRIGNIQSDGRPILGLDARNLLEIVLETSNDAFLVPAHVWTPWFSLLGSKSGFDTVEACFDDLAEHIFALETGLSSDPAMNWRVSDLDRYTLISNSDAHSPAKLGREANLFDTELGYTAIRDAMAGRGDNGFKGTIEFFPEEGKYHVDGHRKCDFRCAPERSRELNHQCPVCGKPLVLGVLYRVEELADRPEGARAPNAKPFESLIPLQELLADLYECGAGTKKVVGAYQQLINRWGSEFDILRRVPREELESSSIPLLGEAVARMRSGQIHFEPGYDGEFGRVRLFAPHEREQLYAQQSLFDMPSSRTCDLVPEPEPSPVAQPPVAAPATKPAIEPPAAQPAASAGAAMAAASRLNEAQQQVVDHTGGPLIIVAGPGTGKTHTITSRIAALLTQRQVSADAILAVTFTNKAAREMRERVAARCPDQTGPEPVITTFHALCRMLLQERDGDRPIAIADDETRAAVMADALAVTQPDENVDPIGVGAAVEFIVRAKQLLRGPDDELAPLAGPGVDLDRMASIYAAYQSLMAFQNLFDFEDLIMTVVRLLESDDQWRSQLQRRFVHLFVDEFQDINEGQYRLIRLLAPERGDICVIGDPDQAIYGFRGSDVRFFESFKSDYQAVRTVSLRRNYRSTETVLQAAFQVMQPTRPSDTTALQVRTYSGIDGKSTLSIVRAASARAEAVAIGRTIEKMVGGTGFHALDFGAVGHDDGARSFSDVAVLYRTGDQGRLIQEVLQAAGIPCQRADRRSLSRSRGTAKLLALLRTLADQAGYADLNHLTDLTAPGISRETLTLFKAWAYAKQLSVVQALNTALRLPIPKMTVARQQRLAALVRFLQNLKQQCSERSLPDAIRLCAESTTLSSLLDENQMEILLAQAQTSGPGLGDLVADLALQRDTDLYRPEAEKVALMTMHAAKGLEFNVVFVAGCEAGLIPFQRPGQEAIDADEERRLFFVAMTRARQELFLTMAERRQIHGRTSDQRPSPFVELIENKLKSDAETRPEKKGQQQLSLF